MKITTEFLTIQGLPLPGECPLPLFSDPKDETSRLLPYKRFNRFQKEKEPLQLTTIILENEHLRAQFLPSLGGRLYSLRDKNTKEELFFRNLVFQPYSLGLRGAWFSGGVEWSIGSANYPLSSCDPVFFGKVDCEDGYSFLRMYNYERMNGLLWQVDFHLPAGAKQLFAHIVIINDHSRSVTASWQTTIAAKEIPGCHLFSSPLPYEVIAYPNGTLLYERSTLPLDTRSGYLLEKDDSLRQQMDGNYITMQSSISEEKSILKGYTSLSFTQAFGALTLTPEDVNYDNPDVIHAVAKGAINHALSTSKLEEKEKFFHRLHILPCTKILHMGSGYGALEVVRRMHSDVPGMPIQLDFPPESLTEAQFDWLAILQMQPITDLTPDTFFSCWMTDVNYLPPLLQYLEQYPNNLKALLFLSVLYFETNHHSVAISIWIKAITIKPLPIFYRNLAYVSWQNGDFKKALAYMEGAIKHSQGHPFHLDYLSEYQVLVSSAP